MKYIGPISFVITLLVFGTVLFNTLFSDQFPKFKPNDCIGRVFKDKVCEKWESDCEPNFMLYSYLIVDVGVKHYRTKLIRYENSKYILGWLEFTEDISLLDWAYVKLECPNELNLTKEE